MGLSASIFYVDEDDYKGVARAKAICHLCEVESECLDFAIATRQEGIWGRTTETERNTLRITRAVQGYKVSVSLRNKQHEQQRLERAFPSYLFDIADLNIHIQQALSKPVEVQTAFVITVPEFAPLLKHVL